MLDLIIKKQDKIVDWIYRMYGQIIIAICVGAIYFGMLVFNPLSYLVGIESLHSFAKVRWANLLRPLALVSPAAACGIASASYLFNVYAGKIAFGAYAFMPFAMLALMLGMHSVSKRIGRTFLKDFTLVSVVGFLSGLLVTVNLSMVTFLVDPEAFKSLMLAMVSWKVISHILVMQLGYLGMAGITNKIKKLKGE